MAGLKEKVVSGLYWTVGSKVGTQVISWVITIYVMRLLDPDDYGLIAMATIFIGLCLLLNEMGIGAALITTKELTDKILKQAFGLILILNIVIFLALIFLSSIIADFFNEPRLTEIIMVLTAQFIIIIFSIIPEARLYRKMDYRSPSIVNIVSELIHGLTTLLLAWFGYGMWALVYGSLAKIAVRTIGLNIADPFFLMPSFKFTGFGAIARFGGIVSANRILWYIYAHSDIFIVGKLLGKTVLGHYSVAISLASMPLDKIGSIINQVAFPAYARLQEDKLLAGQYSIKAARAVSILAFPVFFGISAVAPETIEVILGEKWLMAVFPLQILSLAIPFRAVGLTLNPAVTGTGHPEVTFKCLVYACLIIPLSLLVGVKWGLTGVCIAYLISYTIWFGILLKLALPVLNLKIRNFLPVFTAPILYAVIMYCSVYFTRLLLVDFDLNPITKLVLLALSGAIVYPSLLLLFSRNRVREIILLMRKEKE